MSRNPYAKSLRVKSQQVIPDKREKLRRMSDELHALYDDTLYERIPDDQRRLIERLK